MPNRFSMQSHILFIFSQYYVIYQCIVPYFGGYFPLRLFLCVLTIAHYSYVHSAPNRHSLQKAIICNATLYLLFSQHFIVFFKKSSNLPYSGYRACRTCNRDLLCERPRFFRIYTIYNSVSPTITSLHNAFFGYNVAFSQTTLLICT